MFETAGGAFRRAVGIVCTELDDAFEALTSPIRRAILLALVDENTVAEEDVLPGDALLHAADELDPVLVTTRHCHLPKLERLGYVDRDRRDGTLTRGARWEEIAPLVELLEEHRGDIPDGWPATGTVGQHCR